MLPEGKKPIVMSQDDVCYYPYMDGDGFASKIIIGEDGRPSCEMKMEDGTVSVGSYDLVPILNDFIDEHPDFSYKGAKAIIALTGYEGIFGYRTASSYSESPDYERERELAAKVAQCLRDDGWELASHSWGHLWMGVSGNPEKPYKISDERSIQIPTMGKRSRIPYRTYRYLHLSKWKRHCRLAPLYRGKLPLPVPCFQGLPLFLQCGFQPRLGTAGG